MSTIINGILIKIKGVGFKPTLLVFKTNILLLNYPFYILFFLIVVSNLALYRLESPLFLFFYSYFSSILNKIYYYTIRPILKGIKKTQEKQLYF